MPSRSRAEICEIPQRATSFEGSPTTELAATGKMGVSERLGFWRAMDTIRDRTVLETLWESGKAPWKAWT